ncbi:MAG: cell division protein FtsA [Fimbriimonadaceae bacterium]
MGIATVLDVGSTKVTCLVAEPASGDGINVVAVGTAPCAGVKRGVVTDVEATSRAVAAAVAQVEGKLGSEINDFYVSVNGRHIEGSTARGMVPIMPKLRQVTREDVLQVLNHSRQVPVAPSVEVLHTMPREFVIDDEHGVHQPVGRAGSRLEVSTYVLAGKREFIEPLEQAVGLAGKRVGQLIAGPLASGMGVLSAQDLEFGSVCVDIGGGKTDVAVFGEGSLICCSCVPVGGGLVTSDIAHLVRTSVETAETLKVTHGGAIAKLVADGDSVEVMQLGQIEARPMQRKVLCEIIESRMREIANHVKETLERSGQKRFANGVSLTGGGSLLPGTAELFEGILAVGPVRAGRPAQPLPAMPVNAPSAASFSAAVGLARFAFGSFEDELTPASGANWQSKVRSLWSMFAAKP